MSENNSRDPLEFLGMVRKKFQGQPAKYQEFLNIMKDFAWLRIATDEVIQKVKRLFCGHPDLIYGFNKFLPGGYEINLPSEEELANYLKNINID